MRADIYTTLKASPLSNRGYERSEHPQTRGYVDRRTYGDRRSISSTHGDSSPIPTLEASPLGNRGYERSEHPQTRGYVDRRTPTGCPSSKIPIVVLHPTIAQDGHQLIASCYLPMMLFLVGDIVDDTRFVGLGVGEGTIALFPFHKVREAVPVEGHEIIGGNLKVVDKGSHSNSGMQSHKHMYMVGHAIDAVKDTLMVFAKAVDIHIEVALVGLGDRSRALMSAEDDVVDKFGVCHVISIIGAPRWGAYCVDIFHEPGVLAILVPSVTERGRLHRPDAGRMGMLSLLILSHPGVLAKLVHPVTKRGRLHRPDARRLETLSFDE